MTGRSIQIRSIIKGTRKIIKKRRSWWACKFILLNQPRIYTARSSLTPGHAPLVWPVCWWIGQPQGGPRRSRTGIPSALWPPLLCFLYCRRNKVGEGTWSFARAQKSGSQCAVPGTSSSNSTWEPVNYANSWTTPDLWSEKLWCGG